MTMKEAASRVGLLSKKKVINFTFYCFITLNMKIWGFLKGHVKEEETIEDAALREMKEETGLQNIFIINKICSLIRESVEDGGETEAAMLHKVPNLIEISDVRGDLQIHSDFDIETSQDLGD